MSPLIIAALCLFYGLFKFAIKENFWGFAFVALAIFNFSNYILKG